MKPVKQQDQSNLKWVADFIWNIADDRLRDVYVRGKYRDVILPFTVLRRLDAVLESTKQAVLERKKFLDTHKVAEQDGALRMAAGQAFYNTSEFKRQFEAWPTDSLPHPGTQLSPGHRPDGNGGSRRCRGAEDLGQRFHRTRSEK
jgi:HsdM N-terminal domain